MRLCTNTGGQRPQDLGANVSTERSDSDVLSWIAGLRKLCVFGASDRPPSWGVIFSWKWAGTAKKAFMS